MNKAKPFSISKREVWEAYKQVKANRGAAGVDEQTMQEFDADLKNNLYRIWNRMSSGSYMPPPVLRVDIPKAGGAGTRPLGIPTISDRIAQTVVKRYLEPLVEPVFHDDSYGYRPGRSAHRALDVARQRCWNYAWALDLDIKNFFGSIDWELMMRAVRRHTDCAWVLLYVERWLKAPVQMPDGTVMKPDKGTPQGGVVSPVLANLFLHYALDRWMQKHHPDVPFERYADDAVYHCQSEAQAGLLRQELEARLAECKLALHPDKTKIVYCKQANRPVGYPTCQFDFLGFTFRPRSVMNRMGKLSVGFTPAVSNKAAKAMRQELRRKWLWRRSDLTLDDLADYTRPILRGWIQYYGRFSRSVLAQVLRYVDAALVRWARRKYKSLSRRPARAWAWLSGIRSRQPGLFAHWSVEAAVGR
ncbi:MULTISPECIES: group II intron reverse transcriptase/maturase [Burkholderia]|uniref:RNA-directed DNA polymerase n=1 Tax=Burkholderia contaminans TaxID=488447 RepID=A0A3N8NRR6_9BURK|nr:MULTISPECIES: group II intron reverse transcriptase/maturase [Burkholderia]RQT02021.1 group II intron reverse transcriptase/maturase [Burkholderia contaminans]